MVAAAFMAMVSEKISMKRPNKKQIPMNVVLFSLIGYQYKNRMYTIGFINPKKFSLLNIRTCTNTNMTNLKMFIKNELLIIALGFQF